MTVSSVGQRMPIHGIDVDAGDCWQVSSSQLRRVVMSILSLFPLVFLALPAAERDKGGNESARVADGQPYCYNRTVAHAVARCPIQEKRGIGECILG